MTGQIHNRDAFLSKLAGRLGRKEPLKEIEKPVWSVQPQDKTLAGKTEDELVDILKNQCLLIHTDVIETDLAGLPEALHRQVEEYGGGPVIAWKDERFRQYGLEPLLHSVWPNEQIAVHQWEAEKRQENIELAERANIGITISDITLAESGTAVLFTEKQKGRTVSFLPEQSIILIPKSSIVPRMTQAARMIQERLDTGEEIASCINFITGPSNSADIEMILVVGVHGPVKATYMIIDDI